MTAPADVRHGRGGASHRKAKLAGALRIFGRLGFGEGVAGHITVRDPEFPDQFWVNPFGISFRHIRVSDLILLNHEGEVVYGNHPVNRAAFVLHAAIHPARPDIVAAAHSHSPYGKSFSSLGIPLAPLTQDACAFYEDHAVITEQGGAVVFEIEAGKEFAAKFPTGKAAIHKNHGLFTVGESVDEAAFWFITMERSCQAQLMAMAAGTPERDPPRVRQVHRRADGFPLAGWFSSSRCGRRSAAPIPSCSTEHRPSRSVGRRARSPATSRPRRPRRSSCSRRCRSTSAPRSRCRCSTRSNRRPSPGSASSVRHSRCSPSPAAFCRGWTRRQLVAAAIFGVATALMNTFFYLAIDRIDLGKGVAIEFLGPIAVAAAMTRTSRNAAALVLTIAGVATLGGVEIGDNALGVVFVLAASAMWAHLHRRRVTDRADRPRAGPLAVGLSIGALALTPIGAPWSGPVWASPTLLVLCLLTGVFSNAIGYGIDQFVLRRIPIRRFSLLLALLPVTALVVGWIALDQRPSAVDLVGISLVLVGVATPRARRDRRRRRARLNVNQPCRPRATTVSPNGRSTRPITFRSADARPPSTPRSPPAW